MSENLPLELLGLGVGIGNVLATIGIALAVKRASHRMGQLQLEHDVKHTWAELDYHALSRDQDLELLDELFYPDLASQPDEVKRKRWLCHATRHPLEVMYATIQAGLVDDHAQATSSLESTLRNLVMNDLFFSQVEEFSADQGFIALCRRLRRSRRVAPGTGPPHHATPTR